MGKKPTSDRCPNCETGSREFHETLWGEWKGSGHKRDYDFTCPDCGALIRSEAMIVTRFTLTARTLGGSDAST